MKIQGEQFSRSVAMLFLAKATGAAKKTGPKFVLAVCEALTKFLSDLATSTVIDNVPVAIRLGFLQLRKSIEKHRPALASVMPSAFFLHILCPCIMLPASDISELFSSDNLQPVLTMSTKVPSWSWLPHFPASHS